MRLAPALLALPLLAAGLAGVLAFGMLPQPAPAPVASTAASEAAAFNQLVCPFFPDPNPARPLERCNVRATAETGPANEVGFAMDPADPLHLVAAAKDYNYTRLFPPPPSGELGPLIAYATSFDGGLSWTEGYLEPLASTVATLPFVGPVGNAAVHDSDPVVTFAPDGSPVILTLPYRAPSQPGLELYGSTDGGATFSKISRPYNGQTDKQWIAADPVSGNLYVVTLHTGDTGFVKSTDGGLTWTSPREILDGTYPWIDVGPNGEIYVASLANNGRIKFTRSLDQGATWSPEQVIADLAGASLGAQLFRSPQFAVMAASRADTGVYVVYHDTADAGLGVLDDDIFLVASHDGGVTWGPKQRINDDGLPTSYQFMPVVAVSPNGQDLHIAWMDQRNDPTGQLVEAFYAHSPDQGATWEANIKLSDQPFVAALAHHQTPIPGVGPGVFIGDYIGLAASDDRAVVAFPDTRYGRSDVFVATVV